MRYLLILFAVSAFGESPSFETVRVKIGSAIAKVGVADNNEKREYGLMFVKALDADQGMLFVFDDEVVRAFWMKNTLIPLSIGFFNSKGVLVDVQEMKPAESLMVRHPPTYQSKAPARFALEMNTGWFAKKHIERGARIQLAGVSNSSLLNRALGGAGRSSGAAPSPSGSSGK